MSMQRPLMRGNRVSIRIWMILQAGVGRGRGAEHSLRRGPWLYMESVWLGAGLHSEKTFLLLCRVSMEPLDRELCGEAKAAVPAEVMEAWARLVAGRWGLRPKAPQYEVLCVWAATCFSRVCSRFGFVSLSTSVASGPVEIVLFSQRRLRRRV